MVEIVYSRGINTKQVMAKLGKQPETLLDLNDVLTRFKVDEAMRIPIQDYPEKASPGQEIVHFNLPVACNRSDFTVLLSKIIKSGHFRPPDDEKLPTLLFNNVWVAKVTKFLPAISYGDLKPEWFNSSIGGATDPESLKTLILNRYQKSLPCSDCQEILSQGLSVTFLRLIKKVSWE